MSEVKIYFQYNFCTNNLSWLKFFSLFLIVGRVIIELYHKIVPKTVENFIALCKGDRGKASTGRPLHYKGTIFHKVVKGVFIQGGDVTHLDGSGGESIFGNAFEDENFELKVNKYINKISIFIQNLIFLFFRSMMHLEC